MKHKQLFLYISVIIAFVVIYFLNNLFIEIFCVKKPDFVWRFYYFISAVSALMIFSLIVVQYLNKRYTGYTFLAWTFIKLMLVMGYFLVFVFQPGIHLSYNILYAIVSLYLMYLLYEVAFTIFLMKAKSAG